MGQLTCAGFAGWWRFAPLVGVFAVDENVIGSRESVTASKKTNTPRKKIAL